jgi:hypothetical protein
VEQAKGEVNDGRGHRTPTAFRCSRGYVEREGGPRGAAPSFCTRVRARGSHAPECDHERLHGRACRLHRPGVLPAGDNEPGMEGTAVARHATVETRSGNRATGEVVREEKRTPSGTEQLGAAVTLGVLSLQWRDSRVTVRDGNGDHHSGRRAS